MKKKRNTVIVLLAVMMTMLFSAVSVKAVLNEKSWKKIDGVCYNGNGEAIPKAITRGIDVSSWQGDIDWKKVKADNVDFAFVRASYGSSMLDEKFAQNMKDAAAAGMPAGVYVFSTALTESQALEEAQLAIRQMKGYKVSYPVVIDLEYSSMTRLSKDKVGRIALAFCNEIKKAGYYPMVYCNAWWYRDIIDWSYLKNIDVWIAQYGDRIMPPSTEDYKYTIWQGTDGLSGLSSTKGLIDGISKYNVVDVNFGFVDYTKIITPREKPLSNYKPATEPDLTINLKVGGVDSSGEPIPEKGWQTKNGRTYYYRDFEKVSGWQKIDGKYYYFNTSQKYLYKDKLLISGKKNVCYVDKNGVRVTSQWVVWKGKRYYIDKNGYALKGFKTVDGVQYYFNQTYGYTYRNKKLTSTSGNIYFAKTDGSLHTNGFLTLNEKGKINTYYFNTNGKAHKGWKKLGDYWYCFTGRKRVMRRDCTIALETGEVYVFDERGVCISGKE